jgi:RHS repeat-associated protein
VGHLLNGYPANNNNGNISSQTITYGASGAYPQKSFTQGYTYDGVNRLWTAGESGGWSQTYQYDNVGNRWLTPQSTIVDPFTPTANVYTDGTNHMLGSSAQYADGRGNQTGIGAYLTNYDAENRLISSAIGGTSATYSYDADGRRVMKQSGNVTTVYVYDLQGQLVAEDALSAAATAPPCTTCFLMADHLGSTRMLTDASGNQVQLFDYMPFGELVTSGMTGRDARWMASANAASGMMFTGQMRSPWGENGGLDYFGSRYFSSAQGRFTSPDEPFNDQNPFDPQSWNLYNYGRNNPLINTDPTGRCSQGPDGKMQDDPDGKCADVTSVTVAEKAPKVRDLAAEAQAELARLQYEQMRLIREQLKPKPDIPVPALRELVRQPGIANLPVDCGGGIYGYLGQEVGAGPVNGFVGTVAEIDSQHGVSAGGLAELGAGEGIVGGAGGTATLGANGKIVSEGLVYGGVGAHTPVVSASAGVVAFGHGPRSVSGIGIYGETFLLQKGGGGGIYMNLSTVGRGCGK